MQKRSCFVSRICHIPAVNYKMEEYGEKYISLGLHALKAWRLWSKTELKLIVEGKIFKIFCIVSNLLLQNVNAGILFPIVAIIQKKTCEYEFLMSFTASTINKQSTALRMSCFTVWHCPYFLSLYPFNIMRQELYRKYARTEDKRVFHRPRTIQIWKLVSLHVHL